MPVYLYRSDDTGAPTLNGLAGSLISVLDACLVNGYGSRQAAGWTKEYAGTNLAAYRTAGGNRMFLRVDDTAGQTARLRGYETMSDINTGTGLFPTDGQLSGGGWAYKSNTADSVVRPWIVIADQAAVYLWINSVGVGAAVTQVGTATRMYYFGDLISYKPADAYATMLISGHNSTASNVGWVDATTTVFNGYFIARNYAGTGGAINCNILAVLPGSTTHVGRAGPAFPDPVTGRLNLALLPVRETAANVIRGHLPGMYNVLHDRPGTHLDTVTGTDGQTYLMMYVYPTTEGRAAFRTTGEWR